ncbi:MAG: pilin [Lysobacterales bacterium]
MKQFAARAFAAFVGVLAALLVYYLVVTKPGIQNEFARVDKARNDAKEVGRELERAADESVARARAGFESQAADERRRALVAVAFAAGQSAKLAVAEGYSSLGKWPSSPTEIGWGEPSAYANEGARSVAIESNGVVRIELSDAVAKGASIRLIPTAEPSTYQLRWRCEVEGFRELLRFAPNCNSAPGDSTPALIGETHVSDAPGATR